MQQLSGLLVHAGEGIKVFLLQRKDLPTRISMIHRRKEGGGGTYLQVILHPLRVHRLWHRRPVPALDTPADQHASLGPGVFLGEALCQGVGEDC